VSLESTSAAIRYRSTSGSRARARPRHLGLEGTCPRTGHPDARVGSFALATRVTSRVTRPAPLRARAHARTQGSFRALVQSLAAQLRRWACVTPHTISLAFERASRVTAKSQAPFELDRAFLLARSRRLLGVAADDVSDRRLHSKHVDYEYRVLRVFPAQRSA